MTHAQRVISQLEADTTYRLDQAAREGAALSGRLGVSAQLLALSELYREHKAAGRLSQAAAVKAAAWAIVDQLEDAE